MGICGSAQACYLNLFYTSLLEIKLIGCPEIEVEGAVGWIGTDQTRG